MRFLSMLVLVSGISLSGCTSVPQEVVSLSSLTSNDTKVLHDSYRSLVRKHFEALRTLREQEFATSVVLPYLEDTIVEGKLVEIAQGKVVFDSTKGQFVAPDPTKASHQKLDSLNSWSKEVSATIESLRKDAFADLVKQENDVLDSVDQAFGNVMRGNAAIHGYLISIQKVDAAQNEFMKSIGLDGLPAKVADSLSKASEKAAKVTAKMKDAEANARKTIKESKGG